MIIILLVTAIAIVIYMMFLRQQNHKAQTSMLVQQQAYAEELTRNASKQLDDFLNNIKEKNSLVDNLTEEMAESDTTFSDLGVKEIEQRITELLKSVILTEKDWVNFRTLFEQVHPHFLTTIRTRYASLTPAEVRLLTLINLDVQNKDMAFMLGISTGAVSKLRSRLSKKMEQWHPNADLDAIVRSI